MYLDATCFQPFVQSSRGVDVTWASSPIRLVKVIKWSFSLNKHLIAKTNKQLLPFTKRMGIRLHKIDGLHGVDEWDLKGGMMGIKGDLYSGWSFPWIFPSDSATLNCLLDVEFWFSLVVFCGGIVVSSNSIHLGCNIACLVGIATSGFCFPGYMGERRVGYVSWYPWMHHPLETHYD